MKDTVEVSHKKDLPELSSFDWQDPLLVEESLSETERLLINSVRDFADKELKPRIVVRLMITRIRLHPLTNKPTPMRNRRQVKKTVSLMMGLK